MAKGSKDSVINRVNVRDLLIGRGAALREGTVPEFYKKAPIGHHAQGVYYQHESGELVGLGVNWAEALRNAEHAPRSWGGFIGQRPRQEDETMARRPKTLGGALANLAAVALTGPAVGFTNRMVDGMTDSPWLKGGVRVGEVAGGTALVALTDSPIAQNAGAAMTGAATQGIGEMAADLLLMFTGWGAKASAPKSIGGQTAGQAAAAQLDAAAAASARARLDAAKVPATLPVHKDDSEQEADVREPAMVGTAASWQ